MVLLERIDRRLPHRHGRHQPRCASLPAGLHVHRAVRHPRCRDPSGRADDGAPVGAVRRLRRTLGNRLRRRACSRRGPARRRRRGLRARPAAARSGTDPSLHALARRRAASIRHDVRAGHLPLLARFGAGREADRPELDRRQRRRDAGCPPDDPPRRLGDGYPGPQGSPHRCGVDQVLRGQGSA